VRRYAALAVLLVLGGAHRARAVNFFELEAYPATTEGRGLHEIENTTTYVANGRNPTEEEVTGEEPRRHHLFRTSLEYNYGLTDKIDIAAYLDLDKPNGKDLEYAGSRFRARGALWDKGRFPVDLGWYFEAEVPNQGEADLELEFRPIASRDFGRFSIDLDPIFELPTVADERRTIEFQYAARVYYRLSRNFMPSLEFFGGAGQIRNLDPSREQEHYVFPVVYGRLDEFVPGLHFVFGPGFGITPASDKVIVKAGMEYEFTIPSGGAAVPVANP
jgi:hypothetical protein